MPQEHVENADTQQASISLTNEPPLLDPLENTIGGKLSFMPPPFEMCRIRTFAGGGLPIANIDVANSALARFNASFDHLVGTG